jgi:glycine hydroxymethyltransferase
MSQAQFEKPLASAIFPGIQGGPLMHVIAAKAAAFKEAMTPAFREYQKQVKVNAKVMADTLTLRGLRIVSGGTQSHVFLLDLRAKAITGKAAEEVLGRAHLTVNKNAIPNDPEKPFVTSGIRIGTPAMTTRGFGEPEARALANLMADVLEAPGDSTVVQRVAQQVTQLCRRFPVYGGKYRP